MLVKTDNSGDQKARCSIAQNLRYAGRSLEGRVRVRSMPTTPARGREVITEMVLTIPASTSH